MVRWSDGQRQVRRLCELKKVKCHSYNKCHRVVRVRAATAEPIRDHTLAQSSSRLASGKSRIRCSDFTAQGLQSSPRKGLWVDIRLLNYQGRLLFLTRFCEVRPTPPSGDLCRGMREVEGRLAAFPSYELCLILRLSSASWRRFL